MSCPVCDEDSDSEGLATVGSDSDERGTSPYLEAFACEQGHTLADLTPEQEGRILASALDWLAGALEALEDAHWDSRIDSYREGD